jgi:hypothetical protein
MLDEFICHPVAFLCLQRGHNRFVMSLNSFLS